MSGTRWPSGRSSAPDADAGGDDDDIAPSRARRVELDTASPVDRERCTARSTSRRPRAAKPSARRVGDAAKIGDWPVPREATAPPAGRRATSRANRASSSRVGIATASSMPVSAFAQRGRPGAALAGLSQTTKCPSSRQQIRRAELRDETPPGRQRIRQQAVSARLARARSGAVGSRRAGAARRAARRRCRAAAMPSAPPRQNSRRGRLAQSRARKPAGRPARWRYGRHCRRTRRVSSGSGSTGHGRDARRCCSSNALARPTMPPPMTTAVRLSSSRHRMR